MSISILILFEIVPLWIPFSAPLELLDPKRDVDIKATVSTTQSEFAAQVPITVRAVGSIGTASVGGTGFANVSVLKQIAIVCLAFSGAHSVLNGQVITNSPPQPTDGAVCLGLTNTAPKEDLSNTFRPGAYLAADSATIEWLNPVESTPSIVIYYWGVVVINGTPQRSNTYSDSTQNLHIEPYSTLDMSKTDTKLLVISVIWLVYGLDILRFALNRRGQQKPRTIN